MNSTPSQPIFRFAPSPNGHLHLGHAYSALYTAHWAEAMGGRFLVRLEDIDVARCRPQFVDSNLSDLAWLGLRWEEPVMRQSDRFPVYAGAAERLREMRLLYPCFCSRSQTAAQAGAVDPEGAPLYPGTCRHLPPEEAMRRFARRDPVQYRLDVAKAAERAGPVSIAVAEPHPDAPPVARAARPERWGDVVLQRKDMPTSYHLSVVVDDAAQGVTHVTRGRDMEAATDIHVLLQALLGVARPVYNFHRLLLDAEGRKLAKSRGSPTLRDLRAGGWTAEDVRRRVGALGGGPRGSSNGK